MAGFKATLRPTGQVNSVGQVTELSVHVNRAGKAVVTMSKALPRQRHDKDIEGALGAAFGCKASLTRGSFTGELVFDDLDQVRAFARAILASCKVVN